MISAPIGETLVRLPSCHYGREEPDPNSHAIEGHMYRWRNWFNILATSSSLKKRTVRNQTQTIGPDTIKHLNKHVGHIQHQEIEYLAGFGIRQDSLEVRPDEAGSGGPRRGREGVDLLRLHA